MTAAVDGAQSWGGDLEVFDKRTLRELPWLDGWVLDDVLLENVNMGASTWHSVGLAIRKGDWFAFGSAGSWDAFPIRRAYFELFERATVVEAVKEGRPSFRGIDAAEVFGGWLSRERVFPASTDEGRWCYALTNGVAAHSDVRAAMHSARLEVVERDRVLRSWYGGAAPSSVEHTAATQSLCRGVEIELWRFAPTDGVEVVGAFAFHGTGWRPSLAYGFGAATSRHGAATKAIGECLQVLGFLAADDDTEVLVVESPASAAYHQAAFLRPDGADRLRHWLYGGHVGRCSGPFGQAAHPPHWSYVDLRGPGARGPFVVRAISPGMAPLGFGYGPWCADSVGGCAAVPAIHPLS